MKFDGRKAQRVKMDHKQPVNLMGSDGTWRRSCVLLDISQSGAKIEVEGTLTMHSKSKPATLPLEVQLHGGAGTADGSFTVKYQEWGMKSPSTFILRVSDKVEIHVHAAGRMAAGASN